MQVTASKLDTMSEQRVDDVANPVHDAGVANLAALADYLVAQAKLDALNLARQGFQDAKTKPRAKNGEKAGITATLPPMIRDVKTLLRTRLDKLMTSFHLSNPPFFAGYQSARDRRSPRPGRRRPAGGTTDALATTKTSDGGCWRGGSILLLDCFSDLL